MSNTTEINAYWAVWDHIAVWGFGESKDLAIQQAELWYELDEDETILDLIEEQRLHVNPCTEALYRTLESEGGNLKVQLNEQGFLTQI